MFLCCSKRLDNETVLDPELIPIQGPRCKVYSWMLRHGKFSSRFKLVQRKPFLCSPAPSDYKLWIFILTTHQFCVSSYSSCHISGKSNLKVYSAPTPVQSKYRVYNAPLPIIFKDRFLRYVIGSVAIKRFFLTFTFLKKIYLNTPITICGKGWLHEKWRFVGFD